MAADAPTHISVRFPSSSDSDAHGQRGAPCDANLVAARTEKMSVPSLVLPERGDLRLVTPHRAQRLLHLSIPRPLLCQCLFQGTRCHSKNPLRRRGWCVLPISTIAPIMAVRHHDNGTRRSRKRNMDSRNIWRSGPRPITRRHSYHGLLKKY